MLPAGYIGYYLAPLTTIFETLIEKLTSFRWPPWMSRQRGGHWLRKLCSYCQAKFGLNPEGLNLREKIIEFLAGNTNFLVR